MKISLIGPMSGIEGFNYQAFHDAAKLLRAAGHQVFSPAETACGDTTLPRTFYMRASIGALLGAEAVILLPGWESSAGAKTELRVALALGLSVWTLEAFQTCLAVQEFSIAPDD